MQTISDAELHQLAEQIAEVLSSKNWMMSVAESCTGGLLSKICTDLAGSSAWFDSGFITYSNSAKQKLIHVKSATLEQYGAVSEQTAAEMAHGARVTSNANISVAITGIAGPTGGTEFKPIGTVCFAWSGHILGVITERVHFNGDRDAIRRQATFHALKGIIKNARD
jgi:nicotinamide-nucleotide amidase